ncbi:hypothetical protein K7432_002460 [Basidiobolus ranarum]|uniref:Uncharacterized protein n=1 Tax=Basidiobolus ranarum TaxID=34480 RepID=A0ABR2X1H5_9FUNG
MVMTTLCRTVRSISVRRGFSTTVQRLEASSGAFAERTNEIKVVKKKMGSIGGGILGFIIGGSTAGALSYYCLLEEYQNASTKILRAVDELKASTDQVKEYAQKIEVVDGELNDFKNNLVSKEKVEKTRRELRKLHDSANIEHLELKTHIWAVEQEVHSLFKRRL